MVIEKIDVFKNSFDQEVIVILTNRADRRIMHCNFGMCFINKKNSSKRIFSTFLANRKKYYDNLLSLITENKAYEECYFSLFGEKVFFPKALFVRGDNIELFNYMIKVFKKELPKYLKESIAKFSELFGYDFTLVPLKTNTLLSVYGKYTFYPKTKTSKLTFNLLLCLHSKFVIDSIVAHELSHHFHFNHGREFKKLLYSVFPEYDKAKEILSGW